MQFTLAVGFWLTTVGLGVPGDSLPATPDSIPRPLAPYIVTEACPFECCRLGRWVSEGSTVAYRQEGDTTEVAFEIGPGDTLTALAGNVHMERLGEVVVDDAYGPFSPGDTLITLGYWGEGSYPVWHKGVVRSVGRFWSIPPELTAPADHDFQGQDSRTKQGRMTVAPIMDWWVHVRRNESVGWLRLRNETNYGFWLKERFDGMDGCD